MTPSLFPHVTHKRYNNGMIKTVAYTIDFDTGIVKYGGTIFRPVVPSKEEKNKIVQEYKEKIAVWRKGCDNSQKPDPKIRPVKIDTTTWHRSEHAQQALERYRLCPITLNFGPINGGLRFYQYRRLEELIFEKLFHILGVQDSMLTDNLNDITCCSNGNSKNKYQHVVDRYYYYCFSPFLTEEESKDFREFENKNTNVCQFVVPVTMYLTMLATVLFVRYGTF